MAQIGSAARDAPVAGRRTDWIVARSYIYQPKAWEIDQQLKRLLPELFGAIKIE